MTHLGSAEDPMSRVAAMLDEHGVEQNEELVADLLPLLGRAAYTENWRYREYGSEVAYVTDGDTQRFKATQTIIWPDELIKADREFAVRLLETNCPDREDDYDGWLAAKNFVTDFLYEEVEVEGPVPIPGSLVLEGRKDRYDRWLGWFVRNDGVNLSYALNDANVGTYVDLEDHLMQLGVADEELMVEEEEG
jgi:endonuclease YncB( thermonuclease family)